ncbi:hypothetical protein NE237_028472 [Protea cynaroides]|uniref:Uncharacterized protein n=1 Tax=Protea cynaroides TaxID=273540 RepID=A0A9Q0GSG8_9MAGN|nr:hypothetical protein NE237_028472 [Protea cynaroides]
MVEVPRTSQHDGLGLVSAVAEIDCRDLGLVAGESFSDVVYRGLGSVFWQRWKCHSMEWLCNIAVRLWDLHSGSQEDLQGRQPSMDLIIQVDEPSVREVQSGRDLSLAEGCDLLSHTAVYAGRWRSYGDLRSHLEGMVVDPLFGYTGFGKRGGPSAEATSYGGHSEGGKVVYRSSRTDLMMIVGSDDEQVQEMGYLNLESS